MRRALSIYQYAAPAILAPASFLLWRGDLTGWLVPILWAYIVPGIGTNVLKVWEFDTRLRLGRFRPHHGFVFGSVTALLGWLAKVVADRLKPVPNWAVGTSPLWDRLQPVLLNALILCVVIGACNIAYDIVALRAGILRVYNQPCAEGRSATAIAMDYAPWFFGGFGAIYGAGIVLEEQWALTLCAALLLPTAAYMLQSKIRHGHWGILPIPNQCRTGFSPSGGTG